MSAWLGPLALLAGLVGLGGLMALHVSDGAVVGLAVALIVLGVVLVGVGITLLAVPGGR